jgi:hypothetical protein
VSTERAAPHIYEAHLTRRGAVSRGTKITEAEAIVQRQLGYDIVVCGPDHPANRRLAGRIERMANGVAKRCPPHASAGNHALPHYQPLNRPPMGHAFYETDKRKAS